MAGKIIYSKALIITAALAILGPGTESARGADISSILKAAQEKSSQFDREIKNMVMVQEIRTQAGPNPMLSENKVIKMGDKFRVETNMEAPGMGKMKTIIIHDGKDTWMISPFTGKQKLPDSEAGTHQSQKHWWDFISDKSTLVGNQKVGGRNCHVIEITGDSQLPFSKIWLDRNSLVMVQAESQSPDGSTTRLVYSNFKKIQGGLEIPYKTEVYTGQNLMSTTLIKTLEVNQAVSPSLFDPTQVKAPQMNMQDMMKMMPPEGQKK